MLPKSPGASEVAGVAEIVRQSVVTPLRHLCVATEVQATWVRIVDDRDSDACRIWKLTPVKLEVGHKSIPEASSVPTPVGSGPLPRYERREYSRPTLHLIAEIGGGAGFETTFVEVTATTNTVIIRGRSIELKVITVPPIRLPLNRSRGTSTMHHHNHHAKKKCRLKEIRMINSFGLILSSFFEAAHSSANRDKCKWRF